MLSETTAEMTMGQWEQFEAEIWKERGRAEKQIYFVRWDGENTQENICETAMETEFRAPKCRKKPNTMNISESLPLKKTITITCLYKNA